MFFSMLMTRMSGQFSSVMPKIFHDALVVLDIAINQDEKQFALELLGGGGVVGHDGVEVGGGFGGEEEIVLFQVTTEDLWCGLVGELVDKGQLLLLDELDQGLGSLTVEVDASLIELLEQGLGSLSDIQSGGGVGIKNTEGDIIE